jgi:hypothetical protein
MDETTRMNRMIILTMVIAGAIVFTECEKEPAERGNIDYIGYGTSFGECLGYCIHHLKVHSEVAELKKTGWDQGGELPQIQCSRQLELSEYNNILDSVNVDEFFLMVETIGCPDCADGGAEWVEISYDTLYHRVTFEYNHEPEELARVVPLLREMMSGFEGCQED